MVPFWVNIYKISGQFKSLQQEFAILCSILDTAIKNGQPVFYAIKSIAEIPNVKTAGQLQVFVNTYFLIRS